MFKVTLPYLEMTALVPEYEITRKAQDFGVITSINAKARFSGDDYDTLIDLAKKGNGEEPAGVKIYCVNATADLTGKIRHKKGSYLHKSCHAENEIELDNPFECVLASKANIFDTQAHVIENSEETVERYNHNAA